MNALAQTTDTVEPAPSAGPVTDYDVFFARFGAAARTKHTISPEKAATATNGKRPCLFPKASDLPREFIRLDPWEMEYLFAVAGRTRAGIVEIGRYNGGSAFVMACANPVVPIWSIDIAPQNDDALAKHFVRLGVGANVRLIVGGSHESREDVGPFDLLFVDGDHSYEGCSTDIATWYPRLAAGGHMLFHDSYLGPHGVQDAICDFVPRHPEVEIVKSPYIGARHWHYEAGSLAHLVRRR